MGFFEVDEVQILTEGADPVAIAPRFFTNEAEAWSAYHLTLSYADVSTIPYHSVRIIGQSGYPLEVRTYDRRSTEG